MRCLLVVAIVRCFALLGDDQEEEQEVVTYKEASKQLIRKSTQSDV
jgi:hypothetical protein